jgi:hypothetical protein
MEAGKTIAFASASLRIFWLSVSSSLTEINFSFFLLTDLTEIKKIF